jgi:hypothetical protein
VVEASDNYKKASVILTNIFTRIMYISLLVVELAIIKILNENIFFYDGGKQDVKIAY